MICVLEKTHDPAVRILRLNDPGSLNALSQRMLAEMSTHLSALAHDTLCKVIVLAAQGKAFSAGHHLGQMMQDSSEETVAELFATCSALMLQIQAQPQIIIAQVQGVATAAGCQLVAMCDLAVAAETARFGTTGVNLGLFCATPAVALSRNVGRKAAMQMLVTGEFISAEQALQFGLVNQVVRDSDLEEASQKLATVIAQKDQEALAMGKRLFYQQLETALPEAYHLAGSVMACNLQTQGAQTGIRRFLKI
jgi:enoyl-CoA hydratase/carnithine racemase